MYIVHCTYDIDNNGKNINVNDIPMENRENAFDLILDLSERKTNVQR